MAETNWKHLFGAPDRGSQALSVRVLNRGGVPLLIIPGKARLPAQAALSLYAPQSLAGRLAREVWTLLLPLGFGPGITRDSVQAQPDSALLKFLASVTERNPQVLSGKTEGGVSRMLAEPSFVILAGNPRGVAPRFLIQLFDDEARSVAVVKAGMGPEAAALIHHEAAVLRQLHSAPGTAQPSAAAIPSVLSTFECGHVHAFAMTHAEGRSPRDSEAGRIPQILDAWLRRDRVVQISSLAAWKRLEEAGSGDEQTQGLRGRLADIRVCPAIFHGDFAPWNVRVNPADGVWSVLDWERGEMEGPPAWDWFHYVLQNAALARRKRGAELFKIAENLLASAEFARYSRCAGLAGIGREWLRAYLLYCKNVLRPKEGSPQIEWLLANWRSE
jgi:hypothetical protein